MNPEQSEATASLATGLAEMNEITAPYFETAQGMRTKMEADGWSPTMAEQVAGTWLAGAIQCMWTTMIYNANKES